MNYNDITQQAINLAEGTNTSLSEAANTLCSTFNSYGLSDTKRYFMQVAFSKHKSKYKIRRKCYLLR